MLVARPAEATYAEPGDVGDEGGRLTEVDRDQAEQLAETVRRRRVARIYTSDLREARETGAIVARRLGIESVDLPEVDEELVSDGSGGEVVLRFRAALEAVADLHRGETVLVISHGAAMALAIPASVPTADPAIRQARWIPPCAVAEVAIDSDGWQLLGWPGTTMRTA